MDTKFLKTDRSWIEIDLSALQHNIKELSQLLKTPNQIMAVIKADAYGHGAVRIGKELEKLGVSSFAVATLDEAIELRQHHIQGNILILGFTPVHHAHLLQKYHLTQTVIDYDYALLLNRMDCHINIHIKIDSGMHRLGEDYHDVECIQKLFHLSHLHVTGIFSHLCVADSSQNQDILFTQQQFKNFNNVINKLKDAGYDVGKVHIQSSYGLLNYPEFQYDLIRLGIAIYGVQSSQDTYMKSEINLSPVLSLQTRIVSIHQFTKGTSIGYGRTYTLSRNSLIAVVPLGYADGLPRQLSSHQKVLIHGQRVPIIGQICMDQLMIDVTTLPLVKINDMVTVIGSNENQLIRVEEIAQNAETISNEILSRIGQRLPKIYLKNGYIYEID